MQLIVDANAYAMASCTFIFVFKGRLPGFLEIHTAKDST